jgi:hypothetical protein
MFSGLRSNEINFVWVIEWFIGSVSFNLSHRLRKESENVEIFVILWIFKGKGSRNKKYVLR